MKPGTRAVAAMSGLVALVFCACGPPPFVVHVTYPGTYPGDVDVERGSPVLYQGVQIGRVHSIAAVMDNRAELVAGALSSDPERAKASAPETEELAREQIEDLKALGYMGYAKTEPRACSLAKVISHYAEVQ